MQYKPNLQENQVNANSVLAKGYEADIVFWPKNPKANFRNGKMNISYAITKDYENVRLHRRGENKPNSNPIQTQYKANFQKAKMNVRLYVIEDYRKNDDFAEKKPNPIQSQFKPNLCPMYQTQFFLCVNLRNLQNCHFTRSISPSCTPAAPSAGPSHCSGCRRFSRQIHRPFLLWHKPLPCPARFPP